MADGDIVIRGARPWTGVGWSVPSVISVTDGRIVSIEADNPESAAGERVYLDASGCYAVPGLVNTHTHLFQTLLRGIADGRGLHDWLFAVGEAYVNATPEQAYIAAACGAAELLRSGATTIVEHGYPHPNREIHDAIITAVRDVGIRTVYCRGIADKADPERKWGFEPRLMEPYDDQLAHVEELAHRFASSGSRITVGLAPPNPRALSPTGMREARTLSDKLGLCVSVHLCETSLDDAACRERVGTSAVDYLDANDFLWDRFLGIHCVRVEPSQRSVMAARGCAVSYNPVSNLRLGSGVAPIVEFLALGVPVGLGVDGAASNDTQDMLETLRYGSYVQRGRLQDARVMDAVSMLNMVTSGCNATLGIPPVPAGLRAGLPADIVLLRFERDIASVPVYNPAVTLLTQASSRSIQAVLVSGEVVVEDGRCTRVVERDLVDRMTRVSSSVPIDTLESRAVGD